MLDFNGRKKFLGKTKIEHLHNLAYILANLPGYIFWKDKNAHYIGCNNNLADLLGLKACSEIVGKTDHDFNFIWGSKLVNQFIKDEQHVMQTKQIQSSEYVLPVKRLDGNNLVIRADKIPLYNEKDTVVGMLAIAMDITDQKLSEKTTHIAHTFAEDILYNLPGLIYWKNIKSQYVGFNKNVVTLSGLSRKELLGKTDKDLNWGLQESEEFQQDDQEVMEAGTVKITEYEIPIKRSDGNFIVVRTEKSRLYDREGNIAGVLGVALDITDQKILEEKLLKEKKKAEMLSQVKTEFLKNMEHDIRTPFSGIYSISDILVSQETNEEKKELLVTIKESAKELLDYCNSIVEFSRLESRTLPLMDKKFDLKKLITNIIAMESASAKAKNLRLAMQYNNAPTVLIGDHYRIQRILINLISNAVKFTHEGYVQVSVNVAKPKDDKNTIVLKISVQDTGMGIPEEKQSFIFEKFTRLTPSNKGQYKGTGLGLNIVRQFVDELEGEIELSSFPEKGSLFICIIPFKLPLVSEVLLEEDKYE